MSHPILGLHGLAECCVFAKQSVGPVHCDHPKVAPLLPKLRGQFAEFLNRGSLLRLGIFYPPTCVGLRYGPLSIHRIFSWHSFQLYGSAKGLTSEFNHLAASTHASIRVKVRRCGNINPLSIAYASPPRLRSRLTPGRKSWPGNPWVYGGRGFHPPCRYSCLHPLF